MGEQVLATLYELSRHLRLPISWLHEEARAGRIPSLRVGCKRLYNTAAVERALAERAATGTDLTPGPVSKDEAADPAARKERDP